MRQVPIVACRGDVIENPLTGEKVIFLESTRDTGGELLRFEYVLPPRFSIPGHVHPHQEERHEILSGTLRGRVGGRERSYSEGESAVGPPRVPHAWRNASDREELRIVSGLRSALHLEMLLETSFGVMRAWKTNKLGAPGYLLQLAILADEIKDDFYFTGVPRPVWKAFVAASGVLVRLGRKLGYGTRYPR
jgi:quercetin dioxygenase-like cupin family protein